VKVRKVVSNVIDRHADGLSVRAAVQAVVAANVNEPGTSSAGAQQRAEDRRPRDEGGADARKER
jgi:hypothetical protein